MQISNSTNSTNFKGTFRIKPTEIKAKNEIPELFTQGKQIFNNIKQAGDRVIVLRDNYDKRVGKYIKENEIKGIEYYPQINTKSGLDDEKPEALRKLLFDKTTEVKTGIQKILARISEQKKILKPHKAKKELEKVSNALRLNIEQPIISSNEESTLIRDEIKKRTIEIISPNNATSYVYIKPDSLNEDSIKCIINGKGTIVKTYTTPNEITKFSKLFNQLKKEKVNTLTDK